MIASTILLYRSRTLWAFFRVCRYPICSFRIVCTLLQPKFDDVTDTGLMICIESASKTELGAACALHGWYDGVEGFGSDAGTADRIFAICGGTPSKRRVVIYI